MKKVTQTDDLLVIEFTYDPALVCKMHEMRGRFHNEGGKKWWTVHSTVANKAILRGAGFDVGIIAKTQDKVEAKEIAGLLKQPYSFQQKGIAFLETKKGRALIADEMGLGKTIQAIGYLWNHKATKAIVICPASLKLNWKMEIKRWTGSADVEIIDGGKLCPLQGKWITIINYDVLGKWLPLLKELKAIVVLDEIHYIKTRGAKRTKATVELCSSAVGVIGLSGTPVLNRPVELFNMLKILKPTLFPSFFKYGERYCGASHNGWGWDFSGKSNTDELHDILTSSVMIRRMKKEVLPELPDKTRSIVPLQISNRDEYDLAEDDFLAWLNQQEDKPAIGSDCALAKVEALKQLCAAGKMEMALQWIEDFLASDEKLVVAAHHKSVVATLREKFAGRCVVLDGSCSMEQRQEAVRTFQEDDKVRLFIGNIKAAGVGITLTAASNVAFIELPWTPADLDQFEDRCHRIGQKDAVTCWYLISEDTIEQRILKLLDNKRKVVDAIVDGKDTEEAGLLSQLLKELKEGR